MDINPIKSEFLVVGPVNSGMIRALFLNTIQLPTQKDLQILQKGSVRVLSNAYQVSIMRDL